MKKITEPKDVFVLQLQTLYDIEQEIIKSLPKYIKAATDDSLKEGLEKHLEETKEQSSRIEEIFMLIDETVGKIKSEAIRGCAEDMNAIIKINCATHLKDVLLAGAARNVEHLEVANYMNAIMQAKILGLDQVVDLLSQNLKEEQDADVKLSKVIEENFQSVDTEMI